MDFQAITIRKGPAVEPVSYASQAGHAGHQAAHHAGHKGIGAFAAHFAEMTVAMMVGMMPGMALFGLVLGRAALRTPEIGDTAMALSMAVPMAAWMIVRGHTRRAALEMAVAMIVPVAVLFPLFWLGAISLGTLRGLEHGLMLPAMLVAMLYRRHEYGL